LILVPLMLLVFPALGEGVAEAKTVACVKAEITRTAAQVDVARKALLALPVVAAEPQSDVSPEARQAITAMKSRLGDFVDAYMRSRDGHVTTKAIKRGLSRQAHAFTLKPRIYSIAELPKDFANYGFELWFDVKARGDTRRRVIGIVANFQIECGDDGVLFVFAREHGSWGEVLRWQSKPYATIGEAFGAFNFGISPPDRSGNWYVVATHSPPWCTSNWSEILYSVVRPKPGAVDPKEIFSGSDPLWRGDDDYGTLSVGRSGFELRFHAYRIDTGVHNRVWIRRFRIDGDVVRRIPPVAVSPRDFVDEWVTSPWEQASEWSSPDNTAALKKIHERLRKIGFFDYVSVRKCGGPLFHYQIELVQAPDDQARYFFRVAGSVIDYRMGAVSEQPEATCKGKNVLNSMATR